MASAPSVPGRESESDGRDRGAGAAPERRGRGPGPGRPGVFLTSTRLGPNSPLESSSVVGVRKLRAILLPRSPTRLWFAGGPPSDVSSSIRCQTSPCAPAERSRTRSAGHEFQQSRDKGPRGTVEDYSRTDSMKSTLKCDARAKDWTSAQPSEGTTQLSIAGHI